MSDIRNFDLLKSPLTGTNLIEASAGTGKTYAITGLVLRLILERNIPINEILVVTFTEAATSELKDRIRKRLSEAIEKFSGGGARDELLEELVKNHPDPAAAVRRLNYAINDFDQASIFTIHSFCMRVLHDHAFESGMLFDTELVTDQENLIREIVHDFWRKHFYKASPLFFSYAVAHQVTPDSLRAMVGRNTANPYLKVIPQNGVPDCSELENEFRVHFEKMRQAWPLAKHEIEGLLTTADALSRTKYKKDSIPGWIGAMEACFSGECRDCALFEKFEKFTASHIQSAVKKGAKPPSHPFFHLCDNLSLAQQQLAEGFDRCLLGLKVEFINTIRSELTRRKLDKNIVYYDDLLLLLDRALCGSDADNLAAIVRNKFKAALIDEFQDTDSIQYAIFEKIFGQEKSTLFLIGDPKQAIYGFRGADIFTYMGAAKRASEHFTLGENWRSEPSLIAAVNTIFSHARVPFVYADIAFLPVQPATGKKHELLVAGGEREPPLQIWFLDTEKIAEGKAITRTTAQEVIPNAVAGEISKLLELAREGKAAIGERRLQQGDIAVLVRRNADARLLQEALSDLGIHSVLYNIGNLFETHEAMEVERLLAAVADPSDEKLLKIALVTDMLGVSGEELDHIISDEAGWEEWLIRFGEYHDTWNKHGFFRMFRQLLSREAVLPRLITLVDGERRCTNILHLSEVLHQATIESNLNLLGLAKWLSTQRDPDTPKLEEHQLRLESDENAVKLVTIHKSKGLEYPIVFCPFIGDGSRLRSKDAPFTFHDEADEMRLTLDLGSPARNEHMKLAEKEQLAENLRLLYVALTRAKHRCYLVWGHFKGAETSAPAYLFHQPRTGAPESLPDAVSGRFSALHDDELWSDLEAIQTEANGAIELREMPLGKGRVQPDPEEETVELGCRSFTGSINRNWGISSFSSLISNQPHQAEWADRDEMVEPEVACEEDHREPVPLTRQSPDMFAFPRGTAAGIFLHEVFEQLDFAAQDRIAMEELIAGKLNTHGFEGFWVEPVCDMVERILSVPLDSNSGSFTLAQVQTADRLNELEFTFPLQRLSESTLKDLFSRYVSIAAAPEFHTGSEPSTPKVAQGGFEGIPSRMERLRFKPLEGFMKGFIDLVFRFRDHFYVVDWKSNFLGNRFEDYHQAALQKAMGESFYQLQYHLYTIAVHQYLQTRIPEYHYDSHFGGVYYIFLRGVNPAKGNDYGIYRHRPSAAAIEALCSNLIGKVTQ